MKKVTFIVTILLAMAGAAKAQDTLTARTGMTKPGLGTSNWGPKINSNYDIADSSFAVLATTNVYTSTNTYTGITVYGTAGTTSVSTFTAAGVLQMGTSIQMNGYEVQGATVTPSAAATTLVTKAFATNASNLASGTVPNAQLDSSSITKQGNIFNGASQLTQLDGSGRLPAVSGTNVTNLNASALASGVAPEAQLPHTYASSFTVTSPSGLKVTYNVTGGSVTPSNLTATRSVYYDGNSLVSDANTVVTGSSASFHGTGGVQDDFGMRVGSFTGAGLSTCGDASHALAWSSTNNLFTCQSITGTSAAGGSNGDVQYNSGGSLAGLTGTTTGQALIAQGAGVAPVFGYSGQTFNIQRASISAASATTVNTFVPTSLAVSITPHVVTSSITVSVSCTLHTSNSGASLPFASIFRGTTNLAGASGIASCFGASGEVDCPMGLLVVDYPNTTSATTYTVYLRGNTNGTSVDINNQGQTCYIYAWETGS